MQFHCLFLDVHKKYVYSHFGSLVGALAIQFANALGRCFMAGQIYVDPNATSAAVIMVGGKCYQRVGGVPVPAEVSSVNGTFDSCDECGSSSSSSSSSSSGGYSTCPSLAPDTPNLIAALVLPVVDTCSQGLPIYPCCNTAPSGPGGSGEYSGNLSFTGNSWSGSVTGQFFSIDVTVGCTVCNGEAVWQALASLSNPSGVLWQCFICSAGNISGTFAGQLNVPGGSHGVPGGSLSFTMYPIQGAIACDPGPMDNCGGGVGTATLTVQPI